MDNHAAQFRLLPSIDELFLSSAGQQLITTYTRPLALRALRASLDEARATIRSGQPCPSPETLLAKAAALLEQEQRPNLQSVINATGVIINTNLGRAPLSAEALEAVRQVAGGYSNLEYDLNAGERCSRYAPVTASLSDLTGSEALLVTTNNAAPVLWAVTYLTVWCVI